MGSALKWIKNDNWKTNFKKGLHKFRGIVSACMCVTIFCTYFCIFLTIFKMHNEMSLRR